MKIIKVSQWEQQYRFERFIPSHDFQEYKDLQKLHNIYINKLVELLDNKDEKDIVWKNKYEKIRAKIRDIEGKLNIITEPVKQKMNEENENIREMERQEKIRTEEIFEKAKDDSSFQIKILNAVKDWPRTNNSKIAGYIMRDGDMLALTYDGMTRGMDHRYITQEIDELDGGTDGMMQFMYATGAVRMQHQGNKFCSFNWVVSPSFNQKQKIIEIASKCDEIYIDCDIGNFTFSDYFEMISELRWE